MDIYSYMASKIFNRNYEDCMEWNGNEANIEGKFMRSAIKFTIVDEYSNSTNTPLWNLLCLDFPVLNDMPHLRDTEDKEEFSLIDWLKIRLKNSTVEDN